MNANEFQLLLKKLGACYEAVVWAKGKSLAEVWEQCERGDWLLWLCARMVKEKGWPSRNEIILAGCDCAETALQYVKPGEDRPRLAIECARRYAVGSATLQEVTAAAAAASAAYADAAAAASAYAYAYAAAADAAAYAAYAAAVYAADAADAASGGYAAADAAAKKKAQKQCADLVRKRLKIPMCTAEVRV